MRKAEAVQLKRMEEARAETQRLAAETVRLQAEEETRAQAAAEARAQAMAEQLRAEEARVQEQARAEQ